MGSVDPGEEVTFEIWYEDKASFDMECNLWCDRRDFEDSTLGGGTREFLLSLMFGPRRFLSLELPSSNTNNNSNTTNVLDVVSTNVYRFKYDFADGQCVGDGGSCQDWRRVRWFGREPCAFRIVCPRLGGGHSCGDHGIGIGYEMGLEGSVCREGLVYGGTLSQARGARIGAWRHQGTACSKLINVKLQVQISASR